MDIQPNLDLSSLVCKMAKLAFTLGSILFFLTTSAAAIPRIVQSASAQSPANFCQAGPPCPTGPNSLTVTFSPTVAGNTLVMIFIGTYASQFNDSQRVCTDSSGNPVNNDPRFDQGGVAFYFPQSAAGLTSITCIGGIVSSEAGAGPTTIGGFGSMQFIELPPTQGGFLTQDQSGLLGLLTHASPLSCAGGPLGGFEIRIVKAESSLPVIFTPQSSAVHPLFAIEPANAAIFYGLDSDSQLFNFSPSPVPEGAVAFCQKLTYPFADFVDPVPQLLNETAVVGVNDTVCQGSCADKLATLGRPVQGVAADGVTQAVIRIAADAPGDQFTVTVLNDQLNRSISADEDGAVGNPGEPSLSITQSEITVTAVSTATGAYAFAVYRAPTDFVRGIPQDTTAASRQITIRTLRNFAQVTVPVTIVRPPLVLIHGMWSDFTTWDHFSPLVTGRTSVDPRFSLLRVNYNQEIAITDSSPAYSAKSLLKAKANSMGFAFNVPEVKRQMTTWLEEFRLDRQNPAQIPVAASQFDVVAHSMGGDIARTLPLQDTFLNKRNFRRGALHKVITIGTPHQGTPLPGYILAPESACMRDVLDGTGHAFTTATVKGKTWSGAVGDLATESTGIQAIQGTLNSVPVPPGTPPVPTAMIAGQYTNWASLDSGVVASLIRNIQCPGDPLAQLLTGTGWPTIFGGAANDVMVSVDSQLNGGDTVANFLAQGFLHAPSLSSLSFSLPSELDSNTIISNQVIQLLNTPISDSIFKPLGPSNAP
jgi:pimeloyl-ACP methyl ester carboxylesterase